MAHGAAVWRPVVMLPEETIRVCENPREMVGGFSVEISMASLTLKNIKKVYPFNGDDAKQAKKSKKKAAEEPEKKKVNLQITDEGVVAVQEFSLDIKDKLAII